MATSTSRKPGGARRDPAKAAVTAKRATLARKPARLAGAAKAVAARRAAPARKPAKPTGAARAAVTRRGAAAKREARGSARAAPAASREASAAGARELASISKRVSDVAGDTRALSGDLKSLARIFAGNQKSLVSMKGVLDGLADALEAFQKQTRKIGALEDDTQKLFAGIAEMRSHARTIARLDSEAAKMAETVKGIDERTKRADGLGEITRRVEEGFGSMKGGSEAMARIGGHVEAMRSEIGGLLARATAAEAMGEDIARLKSILEEVQAKGSGGAELAAELAGIAGRVSELAGLPDGVGALQKRLEEISKAAGALGPAVEELRGQVGRIAEGGAEIAALREEFSSMVKAGVASVTDALGRSEGEAAEVRRRVDEIAGEVRALREEGKRASGSPSTEVMAMLRLSEFQASVRMAAESKRGEVADLERMASQTAEAVGAFDRLAAESGPGVRLPVGVRQWAVSKMLECAERWEIRFSDLLGVMRERLGADLMREAVRAEQVREVYGARAVDELEGILGGGDPPQEGEGGGEATRQASAGDGEGPPQEGGQGSGAEAQRQESLVDGGEPPQQASAGSGP